jgi:hypothetical protein
VPETRQREEEWGGREIHTSDASEREREGYEEAAVEQKREAGVEMQKGGM